MAFGRWTGSWRRGDTNSLNWLMWLVRWHTAISRQLSVRELVLTCCKFTFRIVTGECLQWTPLTERYSPSSWPCTDGNNGRLTRLAIWRRATAGAASPWTGCIETRQIENSLSWSADSPTHRMPSDYLLLIVTYYNLLLVTYSDYSNTIVKIYYQLANIGTTLSSHCRSACRFSACRSPCSICRAAKGTRFSSTGSLHLLWGCQCERYRQMVYLIKQVFLIEKIEKKSGQK